MSLIKVDPEALSLLETLHVLVIKLFSNLAISPVIISPSNLVI